LLSPQNNVEIEALSSFDWVDVADDSLPLTYALQVASGENFASSAILLEKTGLTESGYTLLPGERLSSQDSSYYWRVRATDGAANVGEWSTAGSFSFFLPSEPSLPEQPGQPEQSGWLIYLWIGLAVVVVVSVGLLVRRRIVRSRRAQ
jgi:hypothetical protein